MYCLQNRWLIQRSCIFVIYYYYYYDFFNFFYVCFLCSPGSKIVCCIVLLFKAIKKIYLKKISQCYGEGLAITATIYAWPDALLIFATHLFTSLKWANFKFDNNNKNHPGPVVDEVQKLSTWVKVQLPA